MKMKMPPKYYTWAMILFFIFAGLSAFGVSGSLWGILTGIFALASAVLLFLDK
jgi:predicted benzoate:H+ symporter BenE